MAENALNTVASGENDYSVDRTVVETTSRLLSGNSKRPTRVFAFGNALRAHETTASRRRKNVGQSRSDLSYDGHTKR